MLITGFFVNLYNVIFAYLLSLDHVKIFKYFKYIYIFIMFFNFISLCLVQLDALSSINIFLSYYVDFYDILADHFLQSTRIKISDLLNPDTSSTGGPGGGDPRPNPDMSAAIAGRVSTEASTNDSNIEPVTNTFRQPSPEEYVSKEDKSDLQDNLLRDYRTSAKLGDVLTDDQITKLRKILMYDFNHKRPDPRKLYYKRFASNDFELMRDVKNSSTLRKIINKYPNL